MDLIRQAFGKAIELAAVVSLCFNGCGTSGRIKFEQTGGLDGSTTDTSVYDSSVVQQDSCQFANCSALTGSDGALDASADIEQPLDARPTNQSDADSALEQRSC